MGVLSEVEPSEKTRRMLFSPLSFCLASLTILATTTLACGPLSAPSGSSFCATQSCSHIYNFRPCGQWNAAECTCSSSDATCPGGYTKDSDGTKCYILRKGQSGLGEQPPNNKHRPELRCDARQWEQRRQVAARGVQQDGERQHQLCLREEDRVRLQQQHRLGWQEVIRRTITTMARSSGQK